jgi:hypothetical protein
MQPQSSGAGTLRAERNEVIRLLQAIEAKYFVSRGVDA